MSIQIERLQKDFGLLSDEFDRCARTYPPLRHERLEAWTVDGHHRLTEEQWQAFMTLHPEPPQSTPIDWWCWDGPWPITTDEELFGRFWGSIAGLAEFVELANTCGTLLQEAGPSFAKGSGGYDTWLHHMYRVAILHPSMLLESQMRIWGVPAFDTRSFEEVVSEWDETLVGRIPRHPVVHSLAYNVFTSSKSLIRALLAPESVRTWDDPLEDLPFLTGSPTPSSELPVPETNRWVLDGEVFEVAFVDGSKHEATRLSSQRLGGRHIARLIEAEGRAVPALQFESRGTPQRPSPVASAATKEDGFSSGVYDEANKGSRHSRQPADLRLDRQAVEAIENRIQELEHLRPESDVQHLDDIDEELHELKRRLRLDQDVRGRSRPLATDEPTSIFRAVGAALSYEFRKIEDAGCTELANHLKDSIKPSKVVKGYAYQPAVPTTWITAFGSFTATRE